MIKIFTGEDRVKAQEAIKKELGEGYEVFEGENLEAGDLSGIFFGETLFASFSERRVLIKDLTENKEIFEEFSQRIEDFSKTDAKVILFETKLDKRLTSVKNVVKAGVEVVEFKSVAKVDPRAVFNVYDLAFKDGRKAVLELEKIEASQDPYMFFGLLVSQALKRLEWKPKGTKEKRVLKELSRVDMLMKSSSVEPWILIKGFLLRVKEI